jgi:uncharacterized protein
MDKISKDLIKFEFPIFILLTLLLSWWSVPFAEGGILPHGPALATVIILALFGGRQGFSALRQRLTHWRACRWYLIGAGIILAYQGLAYGLNLLMGATIAEQPELPSLGTLASLLLIGGLWEEIGWSGYALPKLQQAFSKRPNGLLVAVLLLGIVRAFWHLPLYLTGTIFWFDILAFEIAFQILIAWIFFRSGESLPTVMLFHFVSNVLGIVMSPVFLGAERASYSSLFMMLAVVIALSVMREFTGHENPQEMPIHGINLIL